jgi:hypothetical protein
MQDGKHLGRLRVCLGLLHSAAEAEPIVANLRRVAASVAPEQRRSQLGQDAPHEVFGRQLAATLVVVDDLAQVSISAVLHVQVEVLGLLQVFALKVLHDVGMAELLEDAELGLQLFLLFLRHFLVTDLLAAENLRSVSRELDAEGVWNKPIRQTCVGLC